MASSPDEEPVLPGYAELHCRSNYSFLSGASFPDELVARAAELGYKAIALTDECSLSGVVRAHVEAKAHPISLIIGSYFQLVDGLRLVLLANDRGSYGYLSHLITVARRQANKGEYRLDRETLQTHHPHACLALWLPDYPNPDGEQLRWLAAQFPKRLWIAVELLLAGDDQAKLAKLTELSETHNVPLCAGGDVHMHVRQRRKLQDTLTAIRLGKPLRELGFALFPNAERHLRSRKRLARIYPAALLQETILIAERCRFSLDELRYEYPNDLIPIDYTAHEWLRYLTEQGMQRRWPDNVPAHVQQLIEHELALVKALNYEPYFLTVYDIVRFAREQGILCQGRGSAANSAICYCLGITEVDPARMELLFERFISKERDEPPDIDVDFEHERREEVIQYIYQRYGRERAALAATVITYQPRSAIRDVGKALGLSLDQVDRLAKSIQWWDQTPFAEQQLQAMGFSQDNEMINRLLDLVQQIIGFPRHLSQHVGGFVISRGTLSHLVPIENASMAERTVIQWEKDDLEALGLLKIDILALGMLTAIRKALTLISESIGKLFTMADIPAEDPTVYKMIQRADTIGVFQIESRAQMTMLPRLKPANYYDLVIEIAIIRPGPIQGDMVHPYLHRRNKQEPVNYPSKAVEKVLQRTLGIPIFQEQVMQLAMVAAGFSAGEADQLRRCMASWKRRGGLEKFEQKLLSGMQARGYPRSFAEQIFKQIQGFGEYGFPESHSASFALLAYASSWLKCYHPAAFTCALLNSQPMGFYAPAQLIQDAKRHSVKVLPVDVNQSTYDCTLVYANKHRAPMLRLGLRMVKGLSQAGAEQLVSTRTLGRYTDIQDLAQRTALNQSDMQSLTVADAFRALSGNRYRAFWEMAGTETGLPLFDRPDFAEGHALLPTPNEAQDIVADYQSIGLTLRRHPLALLRDTLNTQGICTAEQLHELANGAQASVAGLVINRQRPGTASGVIFATLEDETGHTNIVVWPKVAERYRQALLGARLLVVHGSVQQEEGVLHVIAKSLEDFSSPLGELDTHSRDFC